MSGMNKQGRATGPGEAGGSTRQTFTGNRGLQQEELLIFERDSGACGVDLDEPAAFEDRLGGNQRSLFGFDLPRLNKVTVHPAASAAFTKCGPRKRVPPRISMDLPLPGCAPVGSPAPKRLTEAASACELRADAPPRADAKRKFRREKTMSDYALRKASLHVGFFSDEFPIHAL